MITEEKCYQYRLYMVDVKNIVNDEFFNDVVDTPREGTEQHKNKFSHTTSANDKYHDLPYQVAGIQRRKRYIKLSWFDQHFPDHEVIVEIDNPNSIHAFNRSEEEGHAERRCNHFRLIDLTREELYSMGVPIILDDEEEEEKEEEE